MITRVDDGGPWEPAYGYVRAVRAGDHVLVSGTTGSTSDGDAVSGGARQQAVSAWRRLRAAVDELTGPDERVHNLRTRVFLADPAAHDEVATTLEATDARSGCVTVVGVPGLVGGDHVVEIETEWMVTRS